MLKVFKAKADLSKEINKLIFQEKNENIAAF
jgi:hypothetical protein